MNTTHEDHIKGGYFQKGCDDCAKFVGHAVMKGHLKLERRHAFTAVVYYKGFAVGRADEGVPGYTPMSPYYSTYEKAQDKARTLNEQLGLTPKEAFEIVASTMGTPRKTVQEPVQNHD